jgi:hypothetical protein
MSKFVLTPEQLEAVTSDSDHLMIVAPPGCGKTEVLAHRAAHLIGSLEKNQRVLVLTFTNKARSNLEERLRSVLGQTRTRQRIVIRNFHGFAAQVIRAHGRTIGLKAEDLQFPKTNTLRNAMVEMSGADLMYPAEQLLGEIKRHPVSDAEVLEHLRHSQKPGCELALKVEDARQKANQLHYEDLLRHAQCLLHIPAIARLYQAHFGAVLVDEFQDLSLQQLDLARLSCTSRQTFAGDPLQGIFSWAGADPTKVGVEIRKSGAQIVRLHESYRSSPKVLNTVNSISEQVDPESKLISAQPTQWSDGGCSAALVFQDRIQEAETLLNLAAEILSRDSKASVGIICRIKWRRRDIDQVFTKETRFPVRYWDMAIEDPKIVDLIRSTVAMLPRGASVGDARLAVLNVIDPADIDTREQVDEAFDVLKQSDVSTARAAIKSIRVSDPKQAIGPGVHLLNAHTGKGQQFDWVFVVGLEEDHLPYKQNKHGDALAEELRVLIVMLSRARHGLVVTRVKMENGLYGLYNKDESRWWSDIRAGLSSVEEIEHYIRKNVVES